MKLLGVCVFTLFLGGCLVGFWITFNEPDRDWWHGIECLGWLGGCVFCAAFLALALADDDSSNWRNY